MTLITFITGISRDFYRRLVRGEETFDRWRCIVCAGAQTMSVDEDLIPVPSDDDSLLQQERNVSGHKTYWIQTGNSHAYILCHLFV